MVPRQESNKRLKASIGRYLPKQVSIVTVKTTVINVLWMMAPLGRLQASLPPRIQQFGGSRCESLGGHHDILCRNLSETRNCHRLSGFFTSHGISFRGIRVAYGRRPETRKIVTTADPPARQVGREGSSVVDGCADAARRNALVGSEVRNVSAVNRDFWSPDYMEIRCDSAPALAIDVVREFGGSIPRERRLRTN